MDEQKKNVPELPGAEVEPPEVTGRRDFVAKLAKAAIVPAVVAGIAANVSPAHAY